VTRPLSAATVDARRQHLGVQLPARPRHDRLVTARLRAGHGHQPVRELEVSHGTIDLPAAAAWADRSRPSPAMIMHGDAVWNAFNVIGWTWGGDWTSPKDYMHFSANGL
jgi:hypothetical protein